MISGIGTDIVSIERIASAWNARREPFAKKILGQQEYEEYQNRLQQSDARAVRYLATRFAAKEAFGKAFGSGIRHPVNWHDLQILNDDLGKPVVRTTGDLAQKMMTEHWTAQVSVSDEQLFAVAFVVIEKRGAHHE